MGEIIYHNKLVRDGILNKIKKSGAIAVSHVLTDAEIMPALLLKEREEETEYKEADDDHKLEELADRFEVHRAIILESGFTLAQVENAILPLQQDDKVTNEELLRLADKLIELRTIALEAGFTLAQVEQARINKEREVGDFFGRVFLTSTEE